MPRKKRVNLPGVTQLVVQNAFENQAIMQNKADYEFMRYSLQHAAEISDCDVHAYSFTANQIVVLATPKREQGISKLMQSLGKRYVTYRIRNGNPTPRLWAGRHRVSVVESDRFFLVTSHLIERVHLQNSTDPSCVPWYRSSYSENSGEVPLQVLNPHPLYRALAETGSGCATVYRQQSEEINWQRYMIKIRDIIAGRGSLAGPNHLKRLEVQAGVRIMSRQPGRAVHAIQDSAS